MSNDLDTIKSHLIETMDYFHKFCEEHNLEYFLVGGTLLGAVRHKGFIPWDDDIDVVMPREDYNRLKELSSSFALPFLYKDYTQDDSYIYPFAKISNNNMIVEEVYYKPFRCGVWIDVFPLDFTFDNVFLQQVHFLLMDVLRKLLILKSGAFKLGKRSFLATNLSKLLHPCCFLIPRKLLNRIFIILERAPYNYFSQNDHLANLYGAWGIREVAPKKLFEEKILYEFEGYKFWGVKDADFWLKKVYGDYMQLPPKHRRVPIHIGNIIKIRHVR